jgi:hypothetical protein
MVRMAQWAVVVAADRWATERLFQHGTLTVAGGAGVAVDDEVLLVADGDVVALTQAVDVEDGRLVLAYLRRAFDEPVPVDGPLVEGLPVESLVAVPPEQFRRLAAALGGAAADKQSWLVSVALPIEAATPAEAVRQFWSHLLALGPAELPTYVWPYGDELAMQAFVLGEEANQDPEEEDED